MFSFKSKSSRASHLCVAHLRSTSDLFFFRDVHQLAPFLQLWGSQELPLCLFVYLGSRLGTDKPRKNSSFLHQILLAAFYSSRGDIRDVIYLLATKPTENRPLRHLSWGVANGRKTSKLLSCSKTSAHWTLLYRLYLSLPSFSRLFSWPCLALPVLVP